MSDYRLDPKSLTKEGFHTVIVASPDLQGRLIGRRVPAESFDRVIDDGVEVCTCVYAWDVTQSLTLIEANAFAFCGMHNGLPDMTLRPDLATLRPAAWLDGIAICLADPHDSLRGEPVGLSPRVLLKNQIAALAKDGLHAKTGTELEFYLFDNDPRELRDNAFRTLRPTTTVPADFMIHEGNVYEPFFHQLRRDLKASGVDVEAAQSEWGTGQWEMTFRYDDPLEMADRHVLYKLAVRDTAAKHAMSATFMAKPLDGQPGSSCHVHVSMVDDDGRPVFPETDSNQMSDLMSQAVAGVLAHSAEFMAWYAPTVNSYRRANTADVAGWGSTWGMDNRTTSARIVGRQPKDLRFEFRLPGADTNPYLTLSALLASARNGIAERLALHPATSGNAYDTPPSHDFPRHLGDAARVFGASPFTRDALGSDVVDHFVTLLDHEWTTFLSAVSGWDLDRYFDRI